MPKKSEAAVVPRTGSEEALYGKLKPGPGQGANEVAEHQRARIQRAMVEATAANGYQAVKVRALARHAEVSTRAFYQHFSDKEECFLRTHELLLRRLVRCVVASQAGIVDRRERLRRSLGALMDGVAGDPRAARLILVEVHAVGPLALEQLQRAERTLEGRVSESLSSGPDEISMPPLMVKGIVAGIMSVARSRVLGERVSELPELVDDLTDWVLSLHDIAAVEVAELDRQYEWGESAAKYPSAPSFLPERPGRSSVGDRATILCAVEKLVADVGYENLSTNTIRAVAGSSPRTFVANFTGVEDCFLTAFKLRADEALRAAAAERDAASTWAGGVHRAVTSICRRLATDTSFASLCFDKALTPGGGREHDALLTRIVESFRAGMPGSASRVPCVATEASLGAIRGVLQQMVASGHPGQAARSTAALSYLAAAPVVGAKAAAIEIHREIENASGQKLPRINLDAMMPHGQGQYRSAHDRNDTTVTK